VGGINGNRDQGENGKGIQPFFNGGDFGTFGGGREGYSHPLSPNLKVELGVPSLFKEARDGEESCKVHVLTVRDGSCHGLRQVASQRWLAKVRMESGDGGWIPWVEGRGGWQQCSDALVLLAAIRWVEGMEGWWHCRDALLLWLAATLGGTWRRRTGDR